MPVVMGCQSALPGSMGLVTAKTDVPLPESIATAANSQIAPCGLQVSTSIPTIRLGNPSVLPTAQPLPPSRHCRNIRCARRLRLASSRLPSGCVAGGIRWARVS